MGEIDEESAKSGLYDTASGSPEENPPSAW